MAMVYEYDVSLEPTEWWSLARPLRILQVRICQMPDKSGYLRAHAVLCSEGAVWIALGDKSFKEGAVEVQADHLFRRTSCNC